MPIHKHSGFALQSFSSRGSQTEPELGFTHVPSVHSQFARVHVTGSKIDAQSHGSVLQSRTWVRLFGSQASPPFVGWAMIVRVEVFVPPLQTAVQGDGFDHVLYLQLVGADSHELDAAFHWQLLSDSHTLWVVA